MFKGIYDHLSAQNITAEYPYKWRLASIHATDGEGYGGQLRFSTKSSTYDF